MPRSLLSTHSVAGQVREPMTDALNRAIAVGEVHGPAHALDLVEDLDSELDQAAATYARAAAMAPSGAERAFLLDRLGRLSAPIDTNQASQPTGEVDDEPPIVIRGS